MSERFRSFGLSDWEITFNSLGNQPYACENQEKARAAADLFHWGLEIISCENILELLMMR